MTAGAADLREQAGSGFWRGSGGAGGARPSDRGASEAHSGPRITCACARAAHAANRGTGRSSAARCTVWDWVPLRLTRDIECRAPAQPDVPARPALSDLFDLMVAHLTHLPEPEAAGRIALTIRFLIGGLSRWEHDSQADPDLVAPLTAFSLILTDLAVIMLDAPGSVPPRSDAQVGYAHGASLEASH